MIPDAKFVAILRNPADRAFSHFMHFVKVGYGTTEDFVEAMNNPDALNCGNWLPRQHYFRFGFYGEQLSCYYQRFDRNQIKIYIYEDFRQSPSTLLSNSFRFLGVNPDYSIDTSLNP